MITADLVRLHDIRINFSYSPQSRAYAEQYIARREDPSQWKLVPVPTCACCGFHWGISGQEPHFRCQRHVGRNPCAIEGCKCTTKDGGYSASDDYLCSRHYRPLTTIRERRLLAKMRRKHRLARKRHDRTAARRANRAWWAVFGIMIKNARRRSAGDIDMTEINALFGWD